MSRFDTVADKFAQGATFPLAPAKRLFRHIKEVNVGMKCDNRLALTMGGVVPRDLDDVEGLQSADYSVYQIVERNDLLFKLIDLENIKTSRVGHVPQRGIVSPAYIRAEAIANNIETRFYYWYYYAAYLNNVFNGMGAGVRQTLGSNELLGALVPIPPMTEQVRIAHFLDARTARIDALIAEKEELTGRLVELKATSVSELLTRGLPRSGYPNQATRILGAEQVPAHWNVTRLKFVAAVQSGIAKGKDTGDKDTSLVPYLRVANVQDGYLELDEVSEMEVETSAIPRHLLRYGDVLMNEGGDFDKLGRGTVWHCDVEPCIHQNHVFAVRPHDTTDADWIAALTRTAYAKFYFMSRSKQSTNLASISQTNVMELPVLMPPPTERAAILTKLQEVDAAVDALVHQVQGHGERLREYRSALITAAVTGQMDVNAHKEGAK